MADSAAVSSALIGKLVNDATLAGLAPDGVYRDIARHGKSSFVIVTKMADSRAYMFDGMAYEEMTYLVKAVALGTNAGVAAGVAASRIHTLLQHGSLTIAGYTLMAMKLSEDNGSVEYTETDPDNDDARWHHRGWMFDVTVSPT